MSEPDQTSPVAADAPVPPPAQPALPAYAAAPPQRAPEQVLGMRAVIVVALASLIIGGLSGFVIGERTNGGDGRFGHGPGVFQGGRRGFQGPQHGFIPGSPQGVPGQPGQPTPSRPNSAQPNG